MLVIGHASVAAPQNISAAVNYNCVQCVADALAVQLVITLPEQPTAAFGQRQAYLPSASASASTAGASTVPITSASSSAAPSSTPAASTTP